MDSVAHLEEGFAIAPLSYRDNPLKPSPRYSDPVFPIERRAAGGSGGIASQLETIERLESLIDRFEDAQGAHRTVTPVRTDGEAGESANVDERSRFTLREWYVDEDGSGSLRQQRIATGANKPSTAEKDKTALSYWERFTDNPPLCQIDQACLNDFIAATLEHSKRSTAKGNVAHLRWMMNTAKRAGIIADVPAFIWPKVSRKTATAADVREVLIYEHGGDMLRTLSDIFGQLPDVEHKIAFACGASFGPRTEDLLLLRKSDFDLSAERPVVRYVAEKTGTFHVTPLNGWLVESLRLWFAANQSKYVFPTLISHDCKEPRKSRAARRTIAAFKSAALAAGYEFGGRPSREQKPLQVLRATCNERFERHSRRAGEWVLGHGITGVNRSSYQNPGQQIYEAVLTLPEPDCFEGLADALR